MVSEISSLVTEINGAECYPHQVKKILSAILTSDDFWKIIDYSDISFFIVNEILKALKEKEFIKISGDSIELTKSGHEICEKENVFPARKNTCPACNGKSYVIPDYLHSAYQKFIHQSYDRPIPVEEFDQRYATPESIMAKIAFADERGDLRGKKVALLGDDDLLSLAIGLSGLAAEITVFELDPRITEYLEMKSKQMNLKNIKIFKHDIQEPFPKEFQNQFDVFFAGPPENIHLFLLFVRHGLFLLKEPGSAGYFGLTMRDASLRKWNKIQQALVHQNRAVITDILHNFHEYVNWEYHHRGGFYQTTLVENQPQEIWYRSSLYRIEVLPGTAGLNYPILHEISRID